MDFLHDQTHDGRALRVITVIDQSRRERECLEVNFRPSGRCVAQALDEVAKHRGWTKAITVDNGTEFTSKPLAQGAYRRGIKSDYTLPGKPTENGLIESISGRLRDEFLNVNEFVNGWSVQPKEAAAL